MVVVCISSSTRFQLQTSSDLCQHFGCRQQKMPCRHLQSCPWSSDCRRRVVGIITTHTYETAPAFFCLFIPSAVTKSRISLIVGGVLNTIVVHWRKYTPRADFNGTFLHHVFWKLPLESTEKPVSGGRYLQLMMRLTLTLTTSATQKQKNECCCSSKFFTGQNEHFKTDVLLLQHWNNSLYSSYLKSHKFYLLHNVCSPTLIYSLTVLLSYCTVQYVFSSIIW
jgi:hypothetical protein